MRKITWALLFSVLSLLRVQGAIPSIPALCGTCERGFDSSQKTRQASLVTTAGIVTNDTQSFEVIPNVVRANGTDTFRIEVRSSRAVQRIFLNISHPIISASGRTVIDLRDDGFNGDRVAGDLIYTTEP